MEKMENIAMKYKVKELNDLAHKNGLKGVNRLPKERLAKVLIAKKIINEQTTPPKEIKNNYYILWFPTKPVMYSFTTFHKGEVYTGIDEETLKAMVERYDPLNYGKNDHVEPFRKAYASYPHENDYGNMAFSWFSWFPPPPKAKEGFQLASNCLGALKDKRNNVNSLWRTSERGDIMTYIAGACKMQMEFKFTLLNDEVTASGKSEDTIILESNLLEPVSKLGEGCKR